MDPEQTFIRVQERFSQLLKPRIRAALEYFYVVVAVALFCLLVVMHANYVQQPGCSSELSIVETSHAELVQIKITSIGLQSQNAAESNVNDGTEHQLSTGIEVPNVDGDGMMFSGAKFWSNWVGSGARRSKLVLKSWKTENEYLGHLADTPAGSSSSEGDGELDGNAHIEDPHVSLPISARESFETAFIHFCSKWQRRFSFLLRHAKNLLGSFSQFWNVSGEDMLIDVPKWLHMFYFDKVNAFAVQWLETRGRSFEPTYLYTVEKGYFLLPEGAKSRHNIRTVNISISARNSCFGNRWQQLLINKFVGYDTILMNSLLSSPGQGYLYNCQTKEFYDLSYAHEITEGSSRFGDYLVTKCGVLIMSLFVFFTTTMSVSFTLRETQTRMLKFTVQLQHHARHRLPTFQLIFVHVTESLVFVPIMIGILFFLFEFYDDQLLAFMVLILVWLCELFTLISVRTPISMKFFPRFFLLYFLVFHIYFFSYAYGFSYLAFATTAVFMQHLILYFWNRFEVPALQRYMQNRRSHFQQHPDIHITSSAILASTLHITRLNVRNPVLVPVTGPAGNNIRPAGSALASPQADQAAAATNRVPHANGAPVAADLFSEIQSASGVQDNMLLEEAAAARPQPQALPEDASNPSSMNSFGSWFMEGASGRLNSVISLFRDIGDQGHVYTGSPQRLENEHNSPAAAPAPLDSPTRID